jgi:hypothetical protein
MKRAARASLVASNASFARSRMPGSYPPGHGPGHGAAGPEIGALDHPAPDAEVTGDHVVRILRVNRADLLLHP